jgi:excinuclease UvrABC nuclease subunit
MERKDLKRFDLPDCPGVYFFTRGKGKRKEILYVGKATSLRDRVRSYFDDDLIATRGPRLVDVVTKADAVSFETAPTVLEALVREAALIREHMPSGNADGKDGKTFLYAVITDEEIPRVVMVRGKNMDAKEKLADGVPYREAYGPFPSSDQLREALRLIRRIFPFYDTDRPVLASSKHQKARIEFNRQIGQYPRNLDRAQYLRSIHNVGMFLSGRVKKLRTELERRMKAAAKEEAFEEAAMIRNQLYSLDHIQDVSLIREEREETGEGKRIEAYDTAHISGTNAIGVMTVLEESRPKKKEYRSFRIRGYGGKSTNDDIASLTEILKRRFQHAEWGFPHAIVVDGGTTHKKTAERVLAELGLPIPVVAVVKDERHRPREVIGAHRASVAEADAVAANAEAHRFSLSLHRKARSRGLKS